MRELINNEVIRLSKTLDVNETNRRKIAHGIALSVSNKFNIPLRNI